MKRYISIFAVLIVAICSAQIAFADVKIKAKQTMGGQSYENTTYIKGKRQRSEQMGGMMVSLTQCDLRRSIQMNPNAKTYMVSPFANATQTATKPATATTDKNGVVQAGGTITATITTKDTGERKQMFGFTARHLIITMEYKSSPDACSKMNSKMQTDGWYIDAEFVLDCDYGYSAGGYSANRNGGCQDKYEMKTVGSAKRGYPVYEKTTMFDEGGKETYSMVSEVVELSKATLEASLFDVPADYREVSDAAQMYAAASNSNLSIGSSSSDSISYPNSDASPTSGLAANIRNSSQADAPSAANGPKKAGTIRIGLAEVKTGKIGEGITASDLAAAVRNTMASFLKVPNIEVVTLDARLASAIESEAQQKECDFIILTTVSHKKGGGGFGMFKSLAPVLGNVVPMAGAAGGVGGQIAGSVASTAIITAANVSGNVKSKDEITLDLKLTKLGGAPAFAQVYKAKAKSDGEDIISQIIEQAAQSIVDTVGKQG